MTPQVYSSKSTPVLFSDANSAAEWQRANTDEDIAVAISRDEYGYFLVRTLADDDIGTEHDIEAALTLANTFTPPSELQPIGCLGYDSIAAIFDAYAESFDSRN